MVLASEGGFERLNTGMFFFFFSLSLSCTTVCVYVGLQRFHFSFFTIFFLIFCQGKLGFKKKTFFKSLFFLMQKKKKRLSLDKGKKKKHGVMLSLKINSIYQKKKKIYT